MPHPTALIGPHGPSKYAPRPSRLGQHQLAERIPQQSGRRICMHAANSDLVKPDGAGASPLSAPHHDGPLEQHRSLGEARCQGRQCKAPHRRKRALCWQQDVMGKQLCGQVRLQYRYCRYAAPPPPQNTRMPQQHTTTASHSVKPKRQATRKFRGTEVRQKTELMIKRTQDFQPSINTLQVIKTRRNDDLLLN